MRCRLRNSHCSYWRQQKGLKHLKKALLEIDKNLEKSGKICNNEPGDNVYSRHAMQVMPVFKAIDGEKETVSLRESSGRICGEFAYIYPPGIPLLVYRGERSQEEILETFTGLYRKRSAGPGTGRYGSFHYTGNGIVR